MPITDTQRLDWLMQHTRAEFDHTSQGHTLMTYVTSGDQHSNGVSGHFLASGDSKRACIDAFITGNAHRID